VVLRAVVLFRVGDFRADVFFRPVVLRAVVLFRAGDFRADVFRFDGFRAVVFFRVGDFRAAVFRPDGFLAGAFRAAVFFRPVVLRAVVFFRAGDLRAAVFFRAVVFFRPVGFLGERPPALAARALTVPATSSALSTTISSTLSTTVPTTLCPASVARAFFPTFAPARIAFFTIAIFHSFSCTRGPSTPRHSPRKHRRRRRADDLSFTTATMGS
jgi:hypothetical protein